MAAHPWRCRRNTAARAPGAGAQGHRQNRASLPVPVLNTVSPGPSAARACDAAAAAQAAILAGKPFIAVRAGAASGALFDAIAAGLVGEGVVFVRVGGTPPSPVSVGRIMAQIAGAGGGDDDEVARVLHALVARGQGARHLVVAVEGADALAPAALSFLQLLPSLQTPGVPPVQVVFASGAGFWALLDDERFRPVRYGLDGPADDATEKPAVAAAPAGPGFDAPPRRVPLPRLRLLAVAAGTLAVFALGAVAVHQPPSGGASEKPHEPVAPALAAAAVSLQEPVSPAPPAAPAVPTPPPSVTADPEPGPAEGSAAPSLPHPDDPAANRARLRREFDAFLESRGPGARRLSMAERDQLFREYLARRPDPAPPSPTATAGLHVLIHFLATSAPGEAEARRVASVMGPQVSGTELQEVADVPPVATIRYFFPSDRAAALALAAATPVPGGEWQVEDASRAPARPAPGTVELWLPMR